MLNRVDGEMLKPDLLRRGVNLAFDGDLLYLDVNSRRVGINTAATSHALTVNGAIKAGQVLLEDAVISTDYGNLTLAPAQALIVSTGQPNGLAVYGPDNELRGDARLTFDGNLLTVNVPTVIEGTTLSNGNINSSGPLTVSTTSGNITLAPGAGGSVNIQNLTLGNLDPNRVLVTGNSGVLSESTFLTISPAGLVSTEAVTVDNVIISDNTVGTTTGNLVLGGDNLILSPFGGVSVSGFGPELIVHTSDTGQLTVDGSYRYASGIQYIGNTTFSNGLIATSDFWPLTISPTGPLTVTTTVNVEVDSNQGVIVTDLSTYAGVWRDDLGSSLRIAGGNSYSPAADANIIVDLGYFADIGAELTPNGVWNSKIVAYSNGDLWVDQGVFASTLAVGNLQVTDGVISNTVSDGNITLSAGATGSVIMTGTTGVVLPTGTTSERPPAPAIGTTRMNSETRLVEVWDGVMWADVGPNYVAPISQTITGDGSTAQFTLLKETTAAGVIVSINGVLQIPGAAYNVFGDQIQFAQAPEPTDVVEIRLINGYVSLTVAMDNPIIDGGSF